MTRPVTSPALRPAASPSTSAAPASPFRLVAIPRLAAGGRWRVEAMRSLSEPCFLWFTKGQGRITIAGQTRGYTAHNGIFIPAGVMHGFEVGPQVFGTAVFFGRDSGLSLPKEPLHLRIREVHAQQDLNMTLDAVQRELDADTLGHDRAALAHLGLLAVWIERQAARPSAEVAKPDAARKLVARFTAVMEREFRSGAGVGDMAAVLGVTATHLTRCCRLTCGRSAIDLLQDRRIFEARKMLADTKLPVNRIGTSLGFASAAYFTRAFQHMTGNTPSGFRKSQ